MLAMSTVLRRERPFKTIFGFATLLGEDGRPMHKSAGNSIEFDEAADRMGVDVMRWMFASARPDDNILFGWHAADEARRGLLVLWNVYAFFVTYARLAGWTGAGRTACRGPSGRSSIAGSCRAWPGSRRGSRSGCGTTTRRPRHEAIEGAIDDLSTWYLRRSRRRFSRSDDVRDRDAAFATLHAALVTLARVTAPILPFLTEAIYDNLVASGDPAAPDSVHLRAGRPPSWPPTVTSDSRPRWPPPGAPWSSSGPSAARPG